MSDANRCPQADLGCWDGRIIRTLRFYYGATWQQHLAHDSHLRRLDPNVRLCASCEHPLTEKGQRRYCSDACRIEYNRA